MKNRFKKLLGLGILVAVAIAAVPAVDVAAVEANDIVNTATETRRDPDGSVWIKESEPEPQANGFTNSATEIRRDPDGTIWIKAPEHKHKWSRVRYIYRPAGFNRSPATAVTYCEETVDYYGTCKYQGQANPLKLYIITKDEVYSGKPYSSYQVVGWEEWQKGGLKPDKYYFSGRKYKSEKPPTVEGRYTITAGYLHASFSILPRENSVQNGNTQGNTVNDSQNSNIPVGNEPASQSSTPEGNEPTSQSSNIPESNMPTKPAFDSKVCMDKVKDMAGEEIN